MKQDIGDWSYESGADGYGPATKHVWVNEKIDGVVKVELSEGGHIMKCERRMVGCYFCWRWKNRPTLLFRVGRRGGK